METVSNVVNAASKAIWGEQNAQGTTTGNETAGNEPVSGLPGKGTASEPYDQGNAENPADPAGKANVDNPATTSSSDPAPTITTTTSQPDTKTNYPMDPSNAATGGEPKPLENTKGTGVTGASAQNYKPMGGDVIPSESSDPGAVPTSGAVPEHKQQGADRPKAAPEGDEAGAVKSTKDEAEEVLAKRDPNDHSGEPMRIHGGGDVPATQEERRESKVGMPGGQEHGKEAKGTGEQWVKSTGLAADGGDFDATKPGAGREADRLLEEKGIHKDGSGQMDQPAAAAGGSEGKEKVPLGDKIKQKLHIGHKDK